MTLNHHRFSYTDYMITSYMVMLNNCVVALLSIHPAFNQEFREHIRRLQIMRYDTIPEYVQPAQIFQLSEYRV